MKKTVSEILTEATVRRAVMSMNDNPGRNLRNLIETGKKFCKGSYQKHFLSRLYDKLSDENSSEIFHGILKPSFFSIFLIISAPADKLL